MTAHVLSFSDLHEILLPLMVFSIPIIAIMGGIVSGIVRSVGRQRLAELTQRERIAAIERGIDPSKLPPVLLDVDAMEDQPVRQARGLIAGGIITLLAGVGISSFLLIMPPEPGKNIWAVGLIPMMVGAGMLLSAWVIWPRNGRSAPPRAGI
jgi:hypothetical protein